MGRCRNLAKLACEHVKQLPPEVVGDVRLQVSIPSDPKIYAEVPTPSLLVVPFGESRIRTRSSVIRRPQINLSFAGPLTTQLDRDAWDDLSEAVIDSFDLLVLGKFRWLETITDSLWDGGSQANNRFASQYAITFTDGNIHFG